jgi:hypothetical protein
MVLLDLIDRVISWGIVCLFGVVLAEIEEMFDEIVLL